MDRLSQSDRDAWIAQRYGKTPDELRADALREHALGNSLVAYCLWEAADGRLPERRHRRPRKAWLCAIAFAGIFAVVVIALATGGVAS